MPDAPHASGDVLDHLWELFQMMDRLGLRPGPSMRGVRKVVGRPRRKPLQLPQHASPNGQAA